MVGMGAVERMNNPKSWLDAFLGFFYPPICQLCQEMRASPGEGYVCRECWNKVRFIQPPFCQRCGLPAAGEVTTVFSCGNCREMDLHISSARSAVVANEMLLQVIHRYKYHQALWFEPFLTGLLCRQAEPVLRSGGWHEVIPVPLHPVKQREREFNQAERLGGFLAQKLGLPLNTRAVRRVKATTTQTQLTRENRAENMRNAFEPLSTGNIAKKRLILVDDVFTTGATTNACAAALKKAGAGEICVWTVARGL